MTLPGSQKCATGRDLSKLITPVLNHRNRKALELIDLVGADAGGASSTLRAVECHYRKKLSPFYRSSDLIPWAGTILLHAVPAATTS